jgi:hypothetical protein
MLSTAIFMTVMQGKYFFLLQFSKVRKKKKDGGLHTVFRMTQSGTDVTRSTRSVYMQGV